MMMNSEAVRLAVFEAVGQMKCFNAGQLITEQWLLDMNAAVRSLVRSAIGREGLVLPLQINWDAMRYEQDEDSSGSVLLRFPIALEICMCEDTPDKPHFTHEDTCCKFLAHAAGHDLYQCDSGVLPSVIARYASRGDAYKSSIIRIARKFPIKEPLAIAARLVDQR